MLEFQRYQAEFTAHIRNPAAHKKPAGVVAERMAVYRESVLNNIVESVSACFPVCQQVLGKRAWRALLKDFLKNHAAQSPIFREIPQQFLQYLETANNLAPYLKSLAHYEWVELAVSTLIIDTQKMSKKIDLLYEKPVLAPAHMLLAYDYPVHKISARFKPTSPEPAYLLVYRHADFKVKFIELNPITYQLLELIAQNTLTGEQALTTLAQNIQHPDTQAVIQFGVETLNALANQQAIIGSSKH